MIGWLWVGRGVHEQNEKREKNARQQQWCFISYIVLITLICLFIFLLFLFLSSLSPIETSFFCERVCYYIFTINSHFILSQQLNLFAIKTKRVLRKKTIRRHSITKNCWFRTEITVIFFECAWHQTSR